MRIGRGFVSHRVTDADALLDCWRRSISEDRSLAGTAVQSGVDEDRDELAALLTKVDRVLEITDTSAASSVSRKSILVWDLESRVPSQRSDY